MKTTQQQVLIKYKELIVSTANKIATLKVQIDRFSMIRVVLLIIEIFFFISLVRAESDLGILIGGLAMLIPIGVFVIIVKKQNRLTKQENYFKNLHWVYQNEVNVLEGRQNGYENGASFENEGHPYASDLDVFGTASLFALINRCSTKRGVHILAEQLSLPNNKVQINLRQTAVQELTSAVADTFDFRAILKGNGAENIEQLTSKLKNKLGSQLMFTRHALLRIYITLLPFLMPLLILAGLIFGDKAWGILSIILLFHAGLSFLQMKKINDVYYGFGGSSSFLTAYAEAIKWTEEREWKSTYIKGLFATDKKVSYQIRGLAKIIQAFDARLNLVVGGILNFTLLWDLRCCIKLDKWHQSSIDNVENGLNRMSDFEELISLATLSYNHPDWAFPQIENEFVFTAAEVGHPLISAAKNVHNSFSLAQRPTVDIITGSNMAGKSTFLRTVGINMVLAYAGAPVCAKNMQLSIFKILTYMRIKDSLNESTSTFKAELNRLKMILEAVAIHKNALVLIDEMLRGTNSKDKYLGSKVFIEKLISVGTPTLFATHDLQLSELKETNELAVRNFHFDIQMIKGEMEFDYKLKHGPCETFNAAILLKQIGLNIKEL